MNFFRVLNEVYDFSSQQNIALIEKTFLLNYSLVFLLKNITLKDISDLSDHVAHEFL